MNIDPNIIIPALLIATPPTMVALLSMRKNEDNKKNIQELHVLINSRMTELLEVTGKSERMAGAQDQREKEDLSK